MMFVIGMSNTYVCLIILSHGLGIVSEKKGSGKCCGLWNQGLVATNMTPWLADLAFANDCVPCTMAATSGWPNVFSGHQFAPHRSDIMRGRFHAKTLLSDFDIQKCIHC